MALITVLQAADMVGTTHQRIYKAIERGDLKTVPDLPVKLLRTEDVEAWAKIPVSKGGRPRKKDAAPATQED